MASFKQRLDDARQAGDLTIADLANWFDLPFSTIRYWVKVAGYDLAPRGPRSRQIEIRLRQLEWAILNKIGFPVPVMMSERDRSSHMVSTRNAVTASVPSSYLAD